MSIVDNKVVTGFWTFGVLGAFGVVFFSVFGRSILADYQALASALTRPERLDTTFHLAANSIALLCIVGSLIALLPVFQWELWGNVWLSNWKRFVLAVLSVAPIAVAAFSLANLGSGSNRLVTSCWPYAIPLWLVAAPPIFTGRGLISLILEFVSEMPQRAQWRREQREERRKEELRLAAAKKRGELGLAAAKTASGCVEELLHSHPDDEFVRVAALRTLIQTFPASPQHFEARVESVLPTLLRIAQDHSECREPLSGFLTHAASVSATIRRAMQRERGNISQELAEAEEHDAGSDWDDIMRFGSSAGRVKVRLEMLEASLAASIDNRS